MRDTGEEERKESEKMGKKGQKNDHTRRKELLAAETHPNKNIQIKREKLTYSMLTKCSRT